MTKSKSSKTINHRTDNEKCSKTKFHRSMPREFCKSVISKSRTQKSVSSRSLEGIRGARVPSSPTTNKNHEQKKR